MFNLTSFFKLPPLLLTEAVRLYLEHAPDLGHRRKRGMAENVRAWIRFDGPADARQITTDHFLKVRSAILESGRSPVTVECIISTIITLLRHCGPKSPTIPHGRGLLKEVPYAGRRLQTPATPRSAVKLEHIDAVYRAADCATYRPENFDGTPELFWRSFLVIAYNTGLRLGDLFALKWESYVTEDRILSVIASKTGKRQPLPVNAVLKRHLDSLPRTTDRLLMVPAKSDHYLRLNLHALCDEAEVPRFTPQSIRRRAAIEHELAHAGAGGLLLGHSLDRSSAMTFGHYIPALETVLRPASEKVAQPEAFRETNA